MRAVHLVRPGVAATVMAASACTIWAAIDDPYKSEQAATVDAGSEAAAPPGHVIDAGFAPYAITAYGDNVYVVDDRARVHVAADGGTSFADFAGGADVFEPTNRIAASSAGVFWTVDKGIRYCELDGGGCGLLPRGGVPTLIAAGTSVVAWKEAGDAGIGRCDVPLSQCAPTSLPTEPPTSIAVEPDGTIAFASGKQAIGFAGGPGPRTFPVKGYVVNYVATDPVSGDLYWLATSGVGVVPFDGGTASLPTPLNNGGVPSQLFALDDVAYWSLPTQLSTAIDYCKFVGAAGCPSSKPVGAVANFRPDQGIAATSRDVFTILLALSGNPQLLAWDAPP